jgi:hypothetical protein
VNVALSIPGGQAYRLKCFVAGTWQVQDVPRAKQEIAADGATTGDATSFRVQEGVDNLVLVTGADGTKGVRFISVGSANTTTGTVNNVSTLALNIYPPTGLDFGLGVNVPLVAGGNSSTSFTVNGTGIFLDSSAVLVNTPAVKAAGANLDMVVGSSVVERFSAGLTTDRQARNLFSVAVGLTASPTVINANLVKVTSVANAGTDILRLDRTIQKVTIINASASAFILDVSAGTPLGEINGVASYTVAANTRIEVESTDVYPGGYAAFKVIKRAGSAAFDGVSGTAVITDTGVLATSTINVTRTSAPTAALVIGEFATKAAGVGVTVTSHDAAYAPVLADAGTFDYLIMY